MLENLIDFIRTTGFSQITLPMLAMWVIACVLLWLAVGKGFEPLLLVPIAFGALIANLPTRGIITVEETAPGVYESATFDMELVPVTSEHADGETAANGVHTVHVKKVEGGLFDFLSQGIRLELFPPLIFLGVGALTDFGPLIAMPRTLLLGAAAQAGLFITFFTSTLLGFTTKQAAAIGIIGGADGPTAIFLSNKLAPELLGAIAVAAYSYMSLVPLIQPPIMRLLTTDKERKIRMKSLRKVGKLEKLIFSIMVMIVCVLLVPDASALISMLMLGNFLRECAVTERLVKSAQNEIINVLTIFLGTSVGITMRAETFLNPSTLKIILLGVIAFCISTASGVLMAKVMNVLSPKNPVNPLIGSAGVSAVPMAARVSHTEGQRYDPGNYLLMHAMGPNVAGVIGTAVAAGYFISTLG
jgi:sodium ion-translocating decarboxylase beta subunit